MAVLLVTYDLNKPGKELMARSAQDHKSFPWARLSESSYAIKTEQDAAAGI